MLTTIVKITLAVAVKVQQILLMIKGQRLPHQLQHQLKGITLQVLKHLVAHQLQLNLLQQVQKHQKCLMELLEQV